MTHHAGYRQGLRRLRTLRSRALIGQFIFGPMLLLVMLIGPFRNYVLNPHAPHTGLEMAGFLASILAFYGLAVYTSVVSIQCIFAKCPRCGHSFFTRRTSHVFRRRCARCRLPLFEHLR